MRNRFSFCKVNAKIILELKQQVKNNVINCKNKKIKFKNKQINCKNKKINCKNKLNKLKISKKIMI